MELKSLKVTIYQLYNTMTKLIVVYHGKGTLYPHSEGSVYHIAGALVVLFIYFVSYRESNYILCTVHILSFL